MKKIIFAALVWAFVMPSMSAFARDTEHMRSYQDMMSREDAKARLDQGIKFYFGDQPHPAIERKMGTYTSNKKTNAVGKSDDRACEWAFLSAMRSLQQRAIQPDFIMRFRP